MIIYSTHILFLHNQLEYLKSEFVASQMIVFPERNYISYFYRNKTLYSSAAQITIIDEMQARGIIFPERKDSNYQKAFLKPDQVWGNQRQLA